MNIQEQISGLKWYDLVNMRQLALLEARIVILETAP